MMALDLFTPLGTRAGFTEKYTNYTSPLVMPLMSWDLFAEANQRRADKVRKLADINKVKTIAARIAWDNHIDAIFENVPFQAIIITDLAQNIIWVNGGFTTMTGYNKKEALKRTPRFLQGSQTIRCAKKNIRKKLQLDTPFIETIINHRKDGTPYKCEVRIFPLYKNNIKTHYLALEREVV